MAAFGRASTHTSRARQSSTGSLRSAEVSIRAEGLGKRFGSQWAVQNLDLLIQPGEVFGFLGPNGAGKSTTIRMLLGMVRPTCGAAWLAGHPVGDVAQAHRHVAYVPADVALWPNLTGRELLELTAHLGPRADLRYRDQLVDRFQLDIDRRARTYSTGNRQKVALIAAFSTRAPVLVLDEPTSGLDPLMEHVFRALIGEARDRGQTVFLSSHQLSDVEAVCDRVGILRNGILVEVAGLAELRRLRRIEIDVRLSGPVPDLTALAAAPGVEEVRRAGQDRLLLQMNGPFGPALRLLAEGEPYSLGVREPSLEEIFLGYYGERP
jgi:ABC-2 type transport system ATP-binding protein